LHSKLSAIIRKSFLLFSLNADFLFDGSIFAFPEIVNFACRFHSDDFANLDFICFLQKFNGFSLFPSKANVSR